MIRIKLPEAFLQGKGLGSQKGWVPGTNSGHHAAARRNSWLLECAVEQTVRVVEAWTLAEVGLGPQVQWLPLGTLASSFVEGCRFAVCTCAVHPRIWPEDPIACAQNLGQRRFPIIWSSPLGEVPQHWDSEWCEAGHGRGLGFG